MTAQTLTYRKQPRISIIPFILLAIIIALFTLPKAKDTVHAELHAEAASIRTAYDNGCLVQRWTKLDLKSGLQRDHCLVDLGNGQVGDRIVSFCKRIGWFEVSAFAIGDKTLADAIDYLKRKGCQQIYP